MLLSNALQGLGQINGTRSIGRAFRKGESTSRIKDLDEAGFGIKRALERQHKRHRAMVRWTRSINAVSVRTVICAASGESVLVYT